MSKIFHLLVAGTRTYENYDEFSYVMDYLDQNLKTIEIVHGGAKGADSMADRYAKEHNLLLKVFPANWDLYGKQAGYIRNREMHKYLSQFERKGCILFWDGKSKGTAHNIGLAEDYGIPLKIYDFTAGVLKIHKIGS